MKPTDDVSQFPENGMSTTPRTDRQTGCAIPSTHGQSISAELLADPKGIFVHAVFARKLETELAAVKARAEKAEFDLAHARVMVRVLRDALECMLVGACAVGVPHKAEKQVLQDAVDIARAALAATEASK
jgi:hypothetical protein